MATLHEARVAVADAVTAAGLSCTPYAEDSISLPAAFVDTATVAYEGTTVFYCRSLATMSLVTAAQRHDRPGATRSLEDLVPDIVTALGDLGARVESASSGVVNLQGTEVPAVIYSVQLPLE
jgi:hypothetical protein